MWLKMVFVLSLSLSAKSISVRVDQNKDNSNESTIKTEIRPTINYYVSNDANIDSYLVPPDPHRLEEVLHDVVTPATYLLPPQQGQTDYYNPTEPGEQTDWYPIAQNAPKPESIPILYQTTNLEEHQIDKNPRRAKVHEQTYTVPVPSLNLEPPLVDAPNDYLAPTTSEQLQIPDPGYYFNLPIGSTPNNEFGDSLPSYRPKVDPRLALHLIPPQPYILKKYPKKTYPKKYNGEFKPVAIPIAQYADESASEIPRAKPVKLFKPLPSTEIDYFTTSDEKINYPYRKAENKQKLKGEELRQEYPSDVSIENEYIKPSSTEQDTSESYRHPARPAYSAPIKQAPVKAAIAAPAPDERTEFRMHGMKGPHSYQFGYDTGKGKNRQFRYEERDNDGQVVGHYGYMDRHGKLRVVNYSAHPETGFHADAPVEKES